MKYIELLNRSIRNMLKQVKEESYTQAYGEGCKQGKIEAIEDILKLLQLFPEK